MPYLIRKLPNKNRYRVINAETGQIKAKSTSLKKAKAQVRFLLSRER